MPCRGSRGLLEDFGRYVYLPRLKAPSVLLNAIDDGLSLLTWEIDSFAYADSFDEAASRYRGLRSSQHISIPESDPSDLLVKPEVARRQLEPQLPPPREGGEAGTIRPVAGEQSGGVSEGLETPAPGPETPSPRPRRFHGSIVLDSTRVGRDASKVAEEVIAHLAGLPDASVQVTLEIAATIPQGAPDNVVRVVTENSRTLKFSSQGFERE
jgi:hypothetical protein